MKEWIRKRWLVLTLAVLAIWLFTNGIVSCVDEVDYNKQIKGLNGEIAELKQDMEREEEKTKAALEEARTAEEDARKERAEKEKHKANEARLEEEKKGLKAKIAALPPIQVVIHTVEILKVEPQEITLREQGVLFTLAAARTNLEFLEEFTLVKKQRGELQLSLASSEKADKDTQKANVKLKKAIASQKIQIDKWPKVEEKWQEKIDLSEGRRKKAQAKGRKEGGILGGAIVLILWIALGR